MRLKNFNLEVVSKNKLEQIPQIPLRSGPPRPEDFCYTEGKLYKGIFVNFRVDKKSGKFKSGLIVFLDDNKVAYNLVLTNRDFQNDPKFTSEVSFNIEISEGKLIPKNLQIVGKSLIVTQSRKFMGRSIMKMKESSFLSACAHARLNGLTHSKLPNYIRDNIGTVIGTVSIKQFNHMETFVLIDKGSTK